MTGEIHDFMVGAIFEEIQQIKMELGEEENESVRTLRLLRLVLANLLELLPDQMSSDDIAQIIQRISDATCRRLKRVRRLNPTEMDSETISFLDITSR